MLPLPRCYNTGTVTAKLYIGTSGWSYPRGEGTWKGYFYPPGTRDELKRYGQFFDTVEVNSSFYRPPDPETTAHWAEKTPKNFGGYSHDRRAEQGYKGGKPEVVQAGDPRV